MYVVQGTSHKYVDDVVFWSGDDWQEAGKAVVRARNAGCEVVVIRIVDLTPGLSSNSERGENESGSRSQEKGSPSPQSSPVEGEVEGPHPDLPPDEDGIDQGVFCKHHGEAMEKRTKGKKTWYSHRLGQGWCNG